jgi:DNA-binding CsgD family transcriptional regulator
MLLGRFLQGAAGAARGDMAVGDVEVPGTTALRQLGLDAVSESIYLAMLAEPGATVGALCERVGLERTTVLSALDRLAEAELCRFDGRSLDVTPPHTAIDGLITRREDELRAALALLEESRATVGQILGGYLEQHSRHVADGIDRVEGAEAVGALLRHVAETAISDVLTVTPRTPSVSSSVVGRESDALALRRGVTLRTVLPATARADHELWELVLENVRAGLQVRLHPGPPLRCILVDATTAIVPLDPAAVSEGAWVVRTPGLLQPVRLLMEQLWAASAVAEAEREESEEVRVREVYRLLSQGQKDESVARRLGTSVRTVRRLVAVGMEMLGTDSRFEAGVMAERRGWLAG